MTNNINYNPSGYMKGGDNVPRGSYYFLKIPNNFLEPGEDSDTFHNVLTTSAYINSYIKSKTGATQNKQVITSIYDESHLYLLRIKNSNYDNILIFNTDSYSLYPYAYHGLNQILHPVACEGITRHHIIEADQQLKFMHEHSKRFDPKKKYDYNNQHSWANGNLLLGPHPKFNFHDGTKSCQEKEGFFNGNIKTAHKAGINVPENENCQIESYIFSIKNYSKGTEKNKDSIRKCANAFFLTKKIFDEDLNEKKIDREAAKNSVNLFWEHWEELKKLPMLTGVWSPTSINNADIKLKCEVLLDWEEDILNQLMQYWNRV